MPGIHVRTISQLDWLEQRKDCFLTIPGSYWLCHKKNIYKFIFKYHHVARSTKDFAYGKELMKIIRRIIKCNPRQGQQFGTQHLLVTYNHTFWTRQDKMFAVLKFKDHTDAVTFARAFVLTIQFSCLPECMKQNNGDCVATLDSNHPLISENAVIAVESKEMETQIEKSEKENTNDCLDNHLLNSHTESSNKKTDFINKVEKVNRAEDLPSVFSSVKEMDKLNVSIRGKEIRHNRHANSTQMRNKISLDPKIHENKPFRSSVSQSEKCVILNTCEEPIKQCLPEVCNAYKTDASQSNTEDFNKLEIVTDKEQKMLREEPISICENTAVTDTNAFGNISKVPSSDKFVFEENIEQNDCAMDTSNNINNSISIDESNMDSINLPYQYLIEKEIEDSKNKMISCVSSADIKKSPKSNLCINDKFIAKKPSGKKSPTEYVAVNSRTDQTYQKNISGLQRDNKRNIVTFEEQSVDEKKEHNSISNKLNKVERRKQKSSKESEKKNLLPDEKTLRSSDITNLVMEGLMFTIRQDRDSMAVIEQKTKLEPDEVLENSEKAETKLGEKCLVNSSLLKLENLITMIEVPSQIEDKSKYSNTSFIDKHLSKNANDANKEMMLQCKGDNKKQSKNKERSRFEDTRSYLWDCSKNVSLDARSTGSANWLPLQSTSKEISKPMKSIMLDDNEEVEEDIIPEVLQNKTYESAMFVQKLIHKDVRSNVSLINKNFLVDSANKEVSKHKAVVTDHKESFKDNLLSSTQLASNLKASNNGAKNNTGPYLTHNSTSSSSKTPRVVSSKIITMDQLPIVLQNAFRSKLMTQHRTSNNSNDISNCEEGNNNDSKYMSFSSPSFVYNDTVCDENVSSTKNYRDIQGGEYNDSKEEITPLKTCATGILKAKKCTPGKLQNITQEFYQDLVHLQSKKKTASDHPYLRQRRKSLNGCGNTKSNDTQVEMFKLIQDITRGAKVVVKRISTKHISSILGKNASLAKCLN